MIDFHELTYTYDGRDEPAIRDLDLSVGDNEFILIKGRSGSGKSTLAKLATGFLGPDDGEISGSVSIDGKAVASTPREELVESVGLVQQDPESQMVTLRVADEVAFGPENLGLERGEISRRVTDSLEIVGGGDLFGREIQDLSSGEKQKVAIASVLALRPRNLILDEPTSSLDPGSTMGLGVVLGNLHRQGLTIVVIEHRYRWVIEYIDRAVELDKGRAREVGHIGRLADSAAPFRVQKRHHSRGRKLISVRGLSFSYGRRKALHEVDIEVHGGEILGIIGDNGSGKTTLISTIMGFLQPAEGGVEVKGRPVQATSDIWSDIGLVFQNPTHQLIEATVGDEIEFGPRNFGMPDDDIGEKCRIMMDYFDLTGYALSSPHSLSVGEKRRLNVASVAVYEPDIFLLDEPFIGQDLGNVERIMELIGSRVAGGSACVLVTHDPDLAMAYCDRVAFLEEGEIKADGDPESVFRYLDRAGKDWYLPAGWC